MSRFLLLCCAVFTFLLVACSSGSGRSSTATAPTTSLDAIKARGELRVAVKKDAPPFSSPLGDTVVGFDADIAQALAAELGIAKVRFVPVASGERLGTLLRGEVDLVIATMTITRAREQLVDFSVPYFEDGQMLLVKADSALNHYSELGGKKVAAQVGSTSLANLAQVAPAAEVVAVKNLEEGLAALGAGKVDALTSDGLLLLGLQLAHPESALRLLPDRFSSEPYGIAMAENQSDLRDLVNDALMKMWESGQWQAIAGTWFGPGAKHATRLEFAMPVVPR
jgi:polar amino acid transport system substrate-binding protein